MPIENSLEKFDQINLNKREEKIAGLVLREIKDRLRFLNEVGLGYLTLDRASQTLSGGEGQRIRLATQIGSQLRGVLYVLDEPSIGLHPRDNQKLLETLHELRDLGNTVLVVEHDEETIEKADYVVDLGPLAGTHGGEVVAVGTPADIKKSKFNHRKISFRRNENRSSRMAQVRQRLKYHGQRRARAQSEKYRRKISARTFYGRDGRFGSRKINAGRGNSLSGALQIRL